MKVTAWVVSVATAASIGLVTFIGSMVTDQIVWQPELIAFETAHAEDHEQETKAFQAIQQNQEGFKARVNNIERLILRQAVRDISADIRALEAKQTAAPGTWSDTDQRLLDRARADLDEAQRALDAVDDD